MKPYATYALSLFFSFIVMTGFAQTSVKPKQFSNFPSLMSCNEQQLAKAFLLSPGQNISIPFSDNFTFSGTIKSNLSKYANLQSVVIVSPNYSNTIFHLSKITNTDGSVSYVGTIVNTEFFDGFELKKGTSGNYQLNKMETDRVIQNCASL